MQEDGPKPQDHKRTEIHTGMSGLVATGRYKDICVTMFPRREKSLTYEVHVTKMKPDGKPDFSLPLNDYVVDMHDGDQDELEEMIDMFVSRLESGVDPLRLFQDMEEAARANIMELYKKYSQKKE